MGGVLQRGGNTVAGVPAGQAVVGHPGHCPHESPSHPAGRQCSPGIRTAGGQQGRPLRSDRVLREVEEEARRGKVVGHQAVSCRRCPPLRVLLMMLVLVIGCAPAAASLHEEILPSCGCAGALGVRHAYETDREALHEASSTYALVGCWRRGGDDLVDNADVHRSADMTVAPPTFTAADGVACTRSASGADGAGAPGAPTVYSYRSPWLRGRSGSCSGSSGCSGRVGSGRGITPALLVAVCSLVLSVALRMVPRPWVSWMTGTSARDVGSLATRRRQGMTCAHTFAASRRRRAAYGRGAGWRGRLAPPCVHRIRGRRRVCRALEWLRSDRFQRYLGDGQVQATAEGCDDGREPPDDGQTRSSLHHHHQMNLLPAGRVPRSARWRRCLYLGSFPLWCLALAALAGRIGEASNPGPQWCTEGDVLAAAPQGRGGWTFLRLR